MFHFIPVIFASMSVAQRIVYLITGLGTFLIGFKILSDNIGKLANTGLRKIFNKTANSRVAGIGIGALSTAIVQSSSITTVMVVGFVNAGVMSLFQAAAVIMGANIGTTITAQIVALNAFDFGLYAMGLTLIGMFMNMFIHKDKGKTSGLALAGFGLIFLGLQTMKNSMSGIAESDTVTQLLTSINNPFLLLLIGVLLTALVQSSDAVTTIVISMATAGLMIGDAGSNAMLFIILGTNIGTCATALLSTIGASTNAKRAAFIHFLFNFSGAIIFTILLVCWKGFYHTILDSLFPNMPGTQIAMFHTFFNVICVLLFAPFIPVIVKISKIVIPDKKNEEQKHTYLDERMLGTPSIALDQIGKEITRMSKVCIDSLSMSLDGFMTKSTDKSEEIRTMIQTSNNMNREIIYYLVEVSTKEISFHDEILVSGYHHVLDDVLRLGEIADNIIKYTNAVIDEEINFSSEVKLQINEMYHKVLELYSVSFECFSTRSQKLLPQVDSIEEEVDEYRKNLIEAHIKRLNEGRCTPKANSIFIYLVNNLERVGDHLTYVAHSISDQYQH